MLFLKNTFPHELSMKGLKVVMDTANGVLGIELMAAAQALDLREFTPGKGCSTARAVIREVVDFLEAHETVFVVEQNRDAQLRSLLMIELEIPAEKLIPVLHYNGMPIPSECVVQGIVRHLDAEVAA